MILKYTDDPLSSDADKNSSYLLHDIPHTDKLYRMLDAPDIEEEPRKEIIGINRWYLFLASIVGFVMWSFAVLGALQLWEALT